MLLRLILVPLEEMRSFLSAGAWGLVAQFPAPLEGGPFGAPIGVLPAT
jgi:hypothetical protein